MARDIKGTLYRIRGYSSSCFVECEDKNDLLREVAERMIKGFPVASVVEICADGTTPKVKVFSDKNFKSILRDMMKKEGK